MTVKLRALIDTATLVIAVALAVYFYTLAPFEVMIILAISLMIWMFYLVYQIRVTQLTMEEERKEREQFRSGE